ncbi:MAG: metalloprotease [Bradymonadia bacterium]
MTNIHIFTFMGVPVSISPWYILMTLYLSTNGPLWTSLIWAAAMTFSILVHEYGHALMAKRYRLAPEVLLHGWGGLCSHQAPDDGRQDALIVAAGPGAGLLLGLVSWLVGLVVMPFVSTDNLMLYAGLAYFFQAMLHINIFWSLVNLLPLWPLDGGQLFRLGMSRLYGAHRGEIYTHRVGVLVGVVGGVLMYRWLQSSFVLLGGFYLAYSNFQRLRSMGTEFVGDVSQPGPPRKRYAFAKELIAEALYDLEHRRFREASRKAHQARTLTEVNRTLLDQAWAILAVSETFSGNVRGANKALRWAPEIPLVRLARARILWLEGDRMKAWTEAMSVGPLDPQWRSFKAQFEDELSTV